MRRLLVFDGDNWYVRKVRLIEHDLHRDEMVYRCDEPLGGPFEDIEDAFDALRKLEELG